MSRKSPERSRATPVCLPHQRSSLVSGAGPRDQRLMRRRRRCSRLGPVELPAGELLVEKTETAWILGLRGEWDMANDGTLTAELEAVFAHGTKVIVDLHRSGPYRLVHPRHAPEGPAARSHASGRRIRDRGTRELVRTAAASARRP